MIIEYYYPSSLSPARLDRYLAAGWFRSASLLFRSQLICLDEDIFTPINIRVKLKDYRFRKSFCKILKKNKKKFKHIIRPASFDKAKEKLYQQHQQRFKGFILDNLKGYMLSEAVGDVQNSVFDTWEVCVYDEEKLIAVSFFDIGEVGVASILGLYDFDYKKYSLGNYTMLLELEYALDNAKKYYYPGYVLDKPSSFDYKLELGNIFYYNWEGRWKRFEHFPKEKFWSSHLREKNMNLEAELQLYSIDYFKKIYPFFSFGQVGFHRLEFVNSPIIFVINTKETNILKDEMLILEYIADEQLYRLSYSSNSEEYLDMVLNHTIFSEDFETSNSYFLGLLKYQEILIQSPSFMHVFSEIAKLSML